jgi:hypothetical protein
MDFSIDIPKDKVHIIRSLEIEAQKQNRETYELLIEALERYLPAMTSELGLFSLGAAKLPTRDKLYKSRLDI